MITNNFDDRRPVLVLVDAPGGPHPSTYVASLLSEFQVHAVWLAVENDVGQERRRAALRPIADQAGQVDSVGSVLDLEQRVDELVDQVSADGVLAFSERVVHIAQRVAGRYGLPSNGSSTLDALQDKRIQRQRLAAFGMETPAVIELFGEEDVLRAQATVQFPAILKPSVGMGSLATTRIESAAQLLAIWRKSIACVAADLRIAHLTPIMILEEEIVGDRGHPTNLGDYVSVEALMVGGQPRLLGIRDKFPMSSNFRENAHIFPSLRSEEECTVLVECAWKAHQALGIQFGVTHTEIKITSDGPVIIEVNGRAGGGVSEQLEVVAGYSLALNLARASANIEVELPTHTRGWSGYMTPQPPHGRHVVLSAPSSEDVCGLPGIVEVYQVASSGTILDAADGTSANLLRALALVDKPAGLFELAELFKSNGLFRLDRIES